MILIPHWVGFSWNKHPSWACPLVRPNRHALVKTVHPPGTEARLCVSIKCIDQWIDSVEWMLEGRRIVKSELEMFEDQLKAASGHVVVQTKGRTTKNVWNVVRPKLTPSDALRRRHHED